MAKKKKEEVAKKATKNEPKGDVTKVKEKMKMKPEVVGETITKVDLSKPPKTEEDAVQGETTDSVQDTGEESKETGEETKVEVPQPDTVQTEENPVLEEIKVEGEDQEVTVEATAEAVEEAIKESVEAGKELPEGVQKLMNFMDETGGDLNDYVKLNRDYSDMDNQTLLQEYYKQTKPHLNNEEIDFLMEDQFSYDEESDEAKDIKRKKLALKEQVANAKSHLDGLKSKYYEEIKSGSKLTNEQQEAINFYKKSQELHANEDKAKNVFLNKTNKFFGDQFKGFEYNVGDKKFRYSVNDVSKVKETQSDLANFVKKFLTKDNIMQDEAGYHKSLFTAMNSDAVAKHFYEQGKADALKDSVAKSKNINMDPRQELNKNFEAGGMKVKVLGDNTADFKFKIKNK